MIRDILVPEAQSDPYVWMAVLLAHFAIGVCLRLVLAKVRHPIPVIAIGYAGFEALQAVVSGVWLPWDSVVDWVAVMLGAIANGPVVVAVLAVVALIGGKVRR